MRLLLPALLLLSASSATAAEPLVDAPAGTRRAAAQLEQARQQYPQDALLALQAGDAWMAVGAWSRAERAYRAAYALSEGGEAARRGLDAVDAARATRVTSGGSVAGSGFAGDVDWVGGATLGADIDAAFGGRGLAGAGVRLGGVTGQSGPTPWVEGHGSLGIGWRRVGVAAHLGGVSNLVAVEVADRRIRGARGDAGPDDPGPDDPGPDDPGNGGNGPGPGEPPDPEIPGGNPVVGRGVTVGLSARWSPWGDIYVEGSRTTWTDDVAHRGLVAWTSPPVGPLRVEPGGSVAYDGDGPGWTGFATLRLDSEPVSLRAGGRVGDESRPVSLGLRSFWAIPGRVRAGAWAGAGVASDDWVVGLDWEWVRMERTEEGGPRDAHLLVLSVSRTATGGGR